MGCGASTTANNAAVTEKPVAAPAVADAVTEKPVAAPAVAEEMPAATAETEAAAAKLQAIQRGNASRAETKKTAEGKAMAAAPAAAAPAATAEAPAAATMSPEEKCAAELAAAPIVDEVQGYRDDSAFEHGHAPLKEKMAVDRGAWAELNAKCTPPAEGASWQLAMIADQDDASKGEEDGVPYWLSKLAFAKLAFSGGAYVLETVGEATLKTTRGDKSGRGAEYSALELFDGKLLTMDDRTGNVDEIVPNPDDPEGFTIKPLVDADGAPVALYLGDGKKDKGLKCEWATQKGGKLVVGSTGKPRTDDDAIVMHHGEMWVKTLEPSTYKVTNLEGVCAYNALCTAAGVPGAPNIGEKSKGFMVHESGRWSDVHQHWFFAPRKLSRETYDTVSEAYKCINLFIASPGEAPAGGPNPETEAARGAKCLLQPYLGMLPMRGCSDFMFVPGTNDCHLFILRTEESHDGVINTFASVIDLEGNVLMKEQRLTEDRKFEGASWIGGWAGKEGAAAEPSAPGECVIS